MSPTYGTRGEEILQTLKVCTFIELAFGSCTSLLSPNTPGSETDLEFQVKAVKYTTA